MPSLSFVCKGPCSGWLWSSGGGLGTPRAQASVRERERRLQSEVHAAGGASPRAFIARWAAPECSLDEEILVPVWKDGAFLLFFNVGVNRLLPLSLPLSPRGSKSPSADPELESRGGLPAGRVNHPARTETVKGEPRFVPRLPSRPPLPGAPSPPCAPQPPPPCPPHHCLWP